MAHIYPEIREELIAVERSFEQLAMEHAVAPDPKVRATVLEAIRKETQLPGTQQAEAPIVKLPVAKSETGPNPWKWITAASVVLLFGMFGLWFTSNRQATGMEDKVADMKRDQLKNEQIMTALELEKERLSAIQSVLSESSTRKVMLSGTKMAPGSYVKVMWTDDGHKAVMVAESIMPAPKDMQYQLWAIADGKPVSIGLFDYDEVMQMTEPFDVMPENITAFAITMEKRGGSPTPTMENMVVIGEI